ncbi:fimbrial protein [Acinetobacter guillouiae]|uniref:fimbrial protein n=1 Tax=Acinetobacter guillouiae TaxID=106649 RepID=UPI0012504ED4|nr:fimbrial protein [Acinetobacter guillouiae]
MKKLTLSALSAVTLSLACTSVFAIDGTITINGVVTDETCTLTGDGPGASGLKNLTLTLDTVPKSTFTAPNSVAAKKSFNLQLKNAAGTEGCGAATNKALKGLYLSPLAADNLDATNKTLLVNKATGAIAANPVFIQILTDGGVAVDLSASATDQRKSAVTGLDANGEGIATMRYEAQYFSQSGVVAAQNVSAVVNYTLQYN